MIYIVKKMHPSMEKVSELFTDKDCTDFTFSPYMVTSQRKNGLLIFTTHTCALLFADNVFSINELYKCALKDEETRKILLSCRALIPIGCDERLFCEQVRELLLYDKKRQLHGKLHSYIVFTTTACNARCYYCFEHGYASVTMTEETARKTAEYIENHADGEITITWFGGEPLINTKAIDVITTQLSEHGFSYKSRIVTNSYLFTPELIKRAKEKWNMVNAQITLDGTREHYNRVKAYANGDTDAYSRVLDNIQALAESGIHVSIYLTLSRENESDLYALLRELTPIIKAYPERFSVLPNLLHQYGGTEEEDEMQQKLINMQTWLRERKLMDVPALPDYLLINACTADNPCMTVIQADGGLNCCDHISESRPYGSIYEPETDRTVKKWWAERKKAIPECDNCVLYPQCLRLAHCTAKQFACTDIIRRDWLSSVITAMEAEYLRKSKLYPS